MKDESVKVILVNVDREGKSIAQPFWMNVASQPLYLFMIQEGNGRAQFSCGACRLL